MTWRSLRAALAGFHQDVQRVLAASPEVHKWALLERDPLPWWAAGPIVLLGDACHPMMPHMAQGAARAIEDAAIITRCLGAEDDIEEAFRRYEATRQETACSSPRARTLRGEHKGDPGWVYDYDAWQTPIAAARPLTRD